jgi:hypothetical protein
MAAVAAFITPARLLLKTAPSAATLHPAMAAESPTTILFS